MTGCPTAGEENRQTAEINRLPRMNHHGEASPIGSRAATQENIASFGASNAGLQVTQNHGNITANFNYQSGGSGKAIASTTR